MEGKTMKTRTRRASSNPGLPWYLNMLLFNVVLHFYVGHILDEYCSTSAKMDALSAIHTSDV